MTDNEIKAKMKQAIDNAAPDDFERVLSECGEEREGVTVLNSATTKKKNRMWPKMLIAACLALAIIGGAGGIIWNRNYSVASIVSIDVNPSIELRINSNEKVLSCRGMNDDAERILEDMNDGLDLEGVKLDVAVNALIGALLREGYFDSISSAVLVSVEDNDESRSARIQQDLVSWIDDVLKSSSPGTSVYSQNASKSDIESLAHDSCMSTGKATLIQRIINEKGLGNSAFSELSVMSVKELWELLKTNEDSIPIGTTAAVEAAKSYAGVTGDVRYEVCPEFDEMPPCYEVELEINGIGYDYNVDAFSGEVLSGVANVNGVTAGTLISEETAKNAAVAHMRAQYSELADCKIEFTKVELDRDDRKFEVDFICGDYEFEYDIDASTGSVTDWDRENRKQNGGSGNSGTTTPTPVTDIGEPAARAAAFAHACVKESDAERIRVKREYDDGRLEYEIEFYVGTVEYDYTVDGATGGVLLSKIDSHECSPGNHHYEGSSGSHHDHHGSGSTGASTGTKDIGEAAAKKAAFTHAGVAEADVTGLKVEREYDNGRLEYEIEFFVGTTEYEYMIDGTTGSILVSKIEKHEWPNGSGSISTNDIGETAAKKAAFTHAGIAEADVTGLKIERDNDNGRLEYEIEFYVGSTEYEYKIDGITGKVLEYKSEPHGNAGGSSGTNNDIGSEAALAAALAHAGFTESDIRGLKIEREYGRGRIEYEIEFLVGNVEYEYTVDGETGNILNHETDRDD